MAGRDFAAIASQIDAQRDIDITATGDVTLMLAADGEHSTINMASRAAQRGYAADALPYGASKAALINLTEQFSQGCVSADPGAPGLCIRR